MNVRNKIKVVLFLGIILLPLIFQLSGLKFSEENIENRNLQLFPEFTIIRLDLSSSFSGSAYNLYVSIVEYKAKLEKFVEDQFVLKAPLFKLFYSLQKDLFHKDVIPLKVIESENRWMFLGDSYSDVILESLSLKTFSDDELTSITNNLKSRTDWLSLKNIKYYVVVAPNKHSFYSKFIPIQASNRMKKLDQLANRMKSTDVRFINLSEAYSDTDGKRFYEKTGTHWNDYGAFKAYAYLMSIIKNDFVSLSILKKSDFIIKKEITYQEDLSKLLSLRIKEENEVYKLKKTGATRKKSSLSVPPFYSGIPSDYEMRFVNPNKKIKMLIFRDSFSMALVKYLKESFSESVFIWHQDFNEEVINSFHPDIVIHQIAERDLDTLLDQP